MRIAPSLTFASSLLIGGCSSYSATVTLVAPSDAGLDAGDTGGTANTGGTSTSAGSSATGGSSSAAGAIATGGKSAVGGGSATGGVSSTGGASQAGGSLAAGGVSSTGGASSIAGASSSGGVGNTGGATSGVTGGTSSTGGVSATGGAVACTKNTDCVNPDPINCSYTCVNPGPTGTCKPATLIGPTQCATTACDDKAISGFWDAQGKPHIAYGFTETDGTGSIRMQQLKLDGSLDGAAVVYKLPAEQQAPLLLSANAQGSNIAFLFKSRIAVAPGSAITYYDNVFFGITDITGVQSTPSELESDSSIESVRPRLLLLKVTPAGAWLGFEIENNPSSVSWYVTAGSNLASWSRLAESTFEGEFAADVLGNTVMLAGGNCASVSGCTISFAVQRFIASNLTVSGSKIILSQNFQANESPAMGPMNGKMALLWTESQSPGQLFRTLIKEDGTFALNIGTVASGISPRAVVQSSDGGALLVGTFAGGTPTTYQVVAQRLDANLGLVGNPLPIADAETTDATYFETHLSSDSSQVLTTYNQAGAKYRLLSTNFCE